MNHNTWPSLTPKNRLSFDFFPWLALLASAQLPTETNLDGRASLSSTVDEIAAVRRRAFSDHKGVYSVSQQRWILHDDSRFVDPQRDQEASSPLNERELFAAASARQELRAALNGLQYAP